MRKSNVVIPFLYSNKQVINIEREKENPRKDYEKFGDLYDRIGFFYNDIYDNLSSNGLSFNEKFNNQVIKEVLTDVRDNLSLEQDEQSWFNNMKEIGEKHGFAPNGKTFKQNPDAYKGTVGDVAEMIRITLSTRKNSPNLYYVMQILKKEECNRRINSVISNL